MYILYDRKGDSMKIIQCFRKLRISAVYAFCMFSLFLFVYDHYYYDITDTKYYFFSSTTCLAAGILTAWLTLIVFQSKEDASVIEKKVRTCMYAVFAERHLCNDRLFTASRWHKKMKLDIVDAVIPELEEW